VRAALEVARGLGHGVRGKNSIDHQRQRQALEALRQRIEVGRAAYEDLVDADQSVLLGDLAAPPPSSVVTTARAARRSARYALRPRIATERVGLLDDSSAARSSCVMPRASAQTPMISRYTARVAPPRATKAHRSENVSVLWRSQSAPRASV